MKTAEEWSREYWKLRQNPPPRVDGNTPPMHEWNILVQQIQLDAIKEGMRIGANKTYMPYGIQQAILTAAEQLTMKDLM